MQEWFDDFSVVPDIKSTAQKLGKDGHEGAGGQGMPLPPGIPLGKKSHFVG